MSDPTLAIALQEWAVCCRALGDGRVVLAVRKGGIHEHGGGFFLPEHERFLLMPTYLHQEPARLQQAFVTDHAAVKVDPQPGHHRLSLWAEVANVWKVTDLTLIQSLGPELLWTKDELATRFAYRDEPFLYVLALRVMRLPMPITIPDLPAYAGCRSWIPLTDSIPTEGSKPVVSTGRFEIRLDRINAVLAPGRAVSRTLTSPAANRTPRI